MPLPQLVCHKFYFFRFSAMSLPQLVCHNFPPYFGNGIATISLSQNFFFFRTLAMPLPQLVCHIFFPYFSNTIATISLSQIFFFFHFGHSTHTSYPGSRNWAKEFRYSHYRNSRFSLSPFFFFSLILFVEFRQW